MTTAEEQEEQEVQPGETLEEFQKRKGKKQIITNIQEAFDALKEEIERVNIEIKHYIYKTKSQIYREYAKIIAQYIEKDQVSTELKRHFPKDKEIIRYALRDIPEYRDFNKAHIDDLDADLEKENKQIKHQIESYEKSAVAATANADKKVIEKLEKSNAVLKDKIEGLEEELKMVNETHKKELEELTKPQLIKIEDKHLAKIKEKGHRFIMVKDNFIWQSWDHNPTPKEWKSTTEEVGF